MDYKHSEKLQLEDYEKTYSYFSWEKELPSPEDFLNSGCLVFAPQIEQGRGEEIALIWENSQGKNFSFSFREMENLSNQFAHLLKKKGLENNDRVFFFLPRRPEIYYGFIGALKAGGIAGTLFPAFGEQALLDRLGNSQTAILITDSELGKRVESLQEKLPNLREIIFVDQENFSQELKEQSQEFSAEKKNLKDPAIMLYTSATGNTPVCGIVLPHQSIFCQKQTAQWVLDLKPGDNYWCTADPGWITGIAYGILGSWANGVTSFVSAKRFDASHWYKILKEQEIDVWYTAPTALRLLRANPPQKEIELPRLRHICSVGEALEPKLIEWSEKIFSLPIYDTYWQTETGSMVMANYRSVEIKPGSMGKPVPGIYATIIDDQGKELGDNQEGDLALRKNWPSQMIDVWQNKERFQHYFLKDWFVTGDRAFRDEEGYYHFVGRADDVIKTSGERVGPFEVESALVEHPAVLEAGVIGKPDETRGEIIKAFLIITPETKNDEAFREELKQFVKKKLAGHAYPKEIEIVDSLPKNRSGKIVRRILKAKELGQPLGDTSTLIKD